MSVRFCLRVSHASGTRASAREPRHTSAYDTEKGARKGPHPTLHRPRPYNERVSPVPTEIIVRAGVGWMECGVPCGRPCSRHICAKTRRVLSKQLTLAFALF